MKEISKLEENVYFFYKPSTMGYIRKIKLMISFALIIVVMGSSLFLYISVEDYQVYTNAASLAILISLYSISLSVAMTFITMLISSSFGNYIEQNFLWVLTAIHNLSKKEEKILKYIEQTGLNDHKRED
jgi:hypothetical protein